MSRAQTASSWVNQATGPQLLSLGTEQGPVRETVLPGWVPWTLPSTITSLVSAPLKVCL